MLDYKKVWKELVNSKQATAQHCLQYTVIKAIKSKSISKTEIAFEMLKKAFPPFVNTHRLRCSTLSGYDTLHWLIREQARLATRIVCGYTLKTPVMGWLLGQEFNQILDKEEMKEYEQVLLRISRRNLKEESRYMYIFVRQDMKPEYQAVQACHAAFISGATFKVDEPEKVNFVLIGVKGLEELIHIANECAENHIEYREFVEPDFRNEVTALATQTIVKSKYRPFKNYSTLKF